MTDELLLPAGHNEPQPTPTATPVPPPIPTVIRVSIPIPPPAPPRAVPPKAVPPPKPKIDDGVPRLRTYAADLSEEIRERGETLTSIVSKEQAQARPAPPVDQDNRRRHADRRGACAFSDHPRHRIGVGGGIFQKKGRHARHHDEHHLCQQDSDCRPRERPLIKSLTALRNNENLVLGEVEQINVVSNGLPIAPADLATALGRAAGLGARGNGCHGRHTRLRSHAAVHHLQGRSL